MYVCMYIIERELIESLDFAGQLNAAEGCLLRNAYSERLHRYSPPTPSQQLSGECPITAEASVVGSRMAEAAAGRGRRLAAACRWKEALAALDEADPWCCVDIRAACLVELKKSSELFAFAHTLVDAYPNAWTSCFAADSEHDQAMAAYFKVPTSLVVELRVVLPPYYYLSKAKSMEPSAGCVWLAYGHSFAADSEHDQAMAAYFKVPTSLVVELRVVLPPYYYLSKAKSLEPSAGCVWLAYGHSFAADSEHDQAMAAYFKVPTSLVVELHVVLPPYYYLSKAKSLEPSAGCVWLAYGHSFAADSEHDQPRRRTSRYLHH
ncbi:putative CDC16 cell division cycle 16-like protein [Operophtera brumata]|uniref:Putative CDC16 cell division cycle 16-like protein n=1 Tax=Operophtera brumata TaxID=104452 RepID=A0A0L7KUF7_OPEBR|nr:putative CDC16 cell division cycle 16-like protein [Operophtera brumata]